ncbi:MAG: ABC transporter permease [Azospirillum sp.]|nr:ABC transporter permease [Azospirillum sp.]
MGSLAATVASALRHHELVIAMAQRDLKGFGRGAVLGRVWLVLAPLLQVVAYVAVVAFVFGRSSDPDGDRWAYILYVLSGMTVWQICARTLQEATTLIRDRMDLVKQVIYPVETLPVTTLIVSSVGGAVTGCIFLALAAATGHLGAHMLLLPVPLLLLAAFLIGASWLLSVAGVLLKDLRDIVSLLLGLSVLVSPVVLAPTMVSERVWSLVMLNPLAHVVVVFRDVLQGGFHPASWIVFVGLAGGSLLLGAWVIGRMKVLVNEYL